MIGIYRIRNLINNNCYYGSAKNINRRWSKHKSQLKYGRHENVILQRAWDKYGEDSFIFEVIEVCDENELLLVEQKYLDLNPDYNIGKTASGGDNISNHPNRDIIIKNKTKKLRKEVMEMSEEERKLRWSRPKEMNGKWNGGSSIKYCRCGKKITTNNTTCLECRDRCGSNNPFYNKHHSDKTKKYLSESRKGKYCGSQNIIFTINGIEYSSLGEASKKLGIPTTTIRWRLKSNNVKFENYKYN